ncbi:hypothetical protein B566_EDAN014132, partial [Ephemera danica]
MYAISGSGVNINGGTAVQSWYDDHFTQIVWKCTTELGIAIATRGNRTVVVANYSPRGNMQDQFRENVFPKGT